MPNGVPGQVVRAALGMRFELVACPMLLHELEGVLLRPKFRRYLTAEQVVEFVEDIAGVADTTPDPANAETALTRDADDDYLVALARQAPRVNFIVSGDRDLLELVKPRPPVLTPREFLDLVGTEGLESRGG